MNVLVIEHDRGLLYSLSRFLVTQNCKVFEAFDGVIALNNFKEGNDILIIDYECQRIEFIKIIKTLKEYNSDVKVLVLVNDFYVSSDILKDSELIDEFMPRPFDVDEFLEVFNNLKNNRASDGFTLHELAILNKLKENEFVNHDELKKISFNKEIALENYINAINNKLNKEKIEYLEKGFKLVKKYD